MMRPIPSAAIRTHRRSAGVGLVTAIFLLVALSALAVAMVSMFTSQQAGAALDEQGARAYQAARAGVEWGMYRKLRQNACAGTAIITFPAGSSLAGFTVHVTCEEDLTNTSGTRPVITSVACNVQPAGGSCGDSNSPDFVRRRLEAVL